MEKKEAKFEISPEFQKNIINFLFDKYMRYVEYRFNNWLLPVETELSRINIIWEKGNKYRIKARDTGLFVGEISFSENGICYCIEEEYQNLFERALI